jgi:hypothetical protein
VQLTVDAAALTRVLDAGAATLDVLAARLGGPPRDELLWALEDALARGWITASADPCDHDGLCGASAPVVYAAAPRG